MTLYSFVQPGVTHMALCELLSKQLVDSLTAPASQACQQQQQPHIYALMLLCLCMSHTSQYSHAKP